MQQKAQERLESQENVGATFIIVALIYVIWSLNNPRNMVIVMGKGPVGAKYGPIGWKGLNIEGVAKQLYGCYAYKKRLQHQSKMISFLCSLGHHRPFQSLMIFSNDFWGQLAFWDTLKDILICQVCGCYGNYSFINCC